ncbi:MAG: hypothetical protein ABR905_22465, partial [Terracidiphilus sp.]
MATVAHEIFDKAKELEGYSAFKHLAMAVALRRWPSSLFAMFTSYFDCARTGQGGGSIAVCGWLSTGERWLEFDEEWRRVLDSFGVSHFHMKEFAHFHGPYSSGWEGDGPKRAAFLQSLVGAISHHAMAGFACLIESSDFHEVDQEYQVRDYYGNEYALCGRVCVAKVNLWLRAHQLDPAAEYVFDDGDIGRGRLTWLMESGGYPAPIFRPSTDRKAKDGTPVRGLLPLQAADFAAYELRKGWDDFGDATVIEEVERYRRSFRAVGAAL